MPEDTPHDSAHNVPHPAPAKAPSLTDAEANRQVSHGEAPHSVNRPEAEQAPHVTQPTSDPAEKASGGEEQTVKVGARDVVRPSLEDDETTAAEGSLTDRLARKDNTNSGPGPSSVA